MLTIACGQNGRLALAGLHISDNRHNILSHWLRESLCYSLIAWWKSGDQNGSNAMHQGHRKAPGQETSGAVRQPNTHTHVWNPFINIVRKKDLWAMESFSKWALDPQTRPCPSSVLMDFSFASNFTRSENFVAPSASSISTNSPLDTNAPRLTAPPLPRFLAVGLRINCIIYELKNKQC